MSNPCASQSRVDDETPADLIEDLEMLFGRAEETAARLRSLGLHASRCKDLHLAQKLFDYGRVATKFSVAICSDELCEAVVAAAAYLPIPRDTSEDIR